MIDSTPTPSGAVVDQARLGRPSRWLRLMQAARQRKRARMRSRSPAMVRAPWRSRVSRSLQVQKIDSMRWRMGGEVRTVAGFVLAHRAHDEGAHLGDGGREVATRVALAADEHRAAAAAAREELKADL